MSRKIKVPVYIIIPIVACLVALASLIFQGKELDAPAVPVFEVEESGEGFELTSLIIPIASNDFQEVVSRQGQKIAAPDGRSYLLVGVAEGADGDCFAILADYGQKVPCTELLEWDIAPSDFKPETGGK